MQTPNNIIKLDKIISFFLGLNDPFELFFRFYKYNKCI